ncbi:hypothetical protein FACS189460_5020 [Deltaproteobacteria bacterium]|nr:hypothetical protein FACS189460_5020 [Deltaproteobacteria bacterium]
MLEPTRTRLTEKNIVLSVICDKSKLARVKAALVDLNCTIKEESKIPGHRIEPEAIAVQAGHVNKEWFTIDELFPEQRPGAALKAYRYREGLTQKQLAEISGLGMANISNMEHGRRPIGKEIAKRLAKVLNTDWRLLLS